MTEWFWRTSLICFHSTITTGEGRATTRGQTTSFSYLMFL